ncbi:MAG: DUF6266 family protein [Flavobacteriaceae bacterium]|jgi:hypothetical protein|nr:DUF6266 family protein [Flavobacteriaceae bacterium]
MARVVKGIIGLFTGKVGGIVGVIYNGRQIIRSRPKKSTVPPSQAQVDQRNKFREVSQFLKPLRGIQQKFYGNPTPTKTRIHLAMSHHLKEAVENKGREVVWHYNRVLITKGDMGFAIAVQAKITSGLLRLHWAAPAKQHLKTGKTDVVNVVVYCKVNKQFFIGEHVATVSATLYQVPLPPVFSSSVAVWVFISNHAGTRCSSSMYVPVERIN